MTNVTGVLGFSVAAGLLTITPGLDTALVLRTAAVEGARSARLAAFGICCGCLVWGCATAFGLTALLAVSRTAFGTLRIAGACYLVYLGIQMWRHRPDFQQQLVSETPLNKRHAWYWYLRGLMCDVLNPKVGVFYITLLPQFVPHGANVLDYSLGFAFIHFVLVMVWLITLTALVRPLRAWLTRPCITRMVDCTTGTVLIGAGVALAIERW
jgi:threonine/homoserine/homoserine lactone efflux protein